MSQNNTQEEGAKSGPPKKPIALPLKSHYMRTVSAQPTIAENTTSQSGENKEVKLNTNAPAFVPKEKRPELTSTTTIKPEVKETPVITSNPQPTSQTVYSSQSFPTMPIPAFQGQKPYNQNSYIPYTYLNTTPMAYPGYPSPNTRGPQQFFPNQMGMAPNMPYQPQYQVPPFGQKIPMTNYGMTAPLNPTATSFTPLSTPSPNPTLTSQSSSSLSDKKFNFSKESKSFIPKSLRGKESTESGEKLSERKTSISDDTSKENLKQEIQVEKKDDIKQQEVISENKTEIKPQIITNKTSVESKIQTPLKEEIQIEAEQKKEEKPVQINIEATTPVITENSITTESKTEEPKKVEKKSKLSDLLNQPSLGPKTTPAITNKKVVVATPTVVLSKPKVNDVQKSLEEKRKQLLSQQKLQSVKPITPITSQTKKCIIYIINKFFRF